jgi:hypothetical protein
MRNCGHCHTCGTKLRIVLDGEEWCAKCGEYRRYATHGWGYVVGDKSSRCPEPRRDDHEYERHLEMPHEIRYGEDAHLESEYEDRTYCEEA